MTSKVMEDAGSVVVVDRHLASWRAESFPSSNRSGIMREDAA